MIDNKLSYESLFNTIFSAEEAKDDGKYYIFMRLYDAVYKKNGATAQLDKLIKGVDFDTNKDNVGAFNHAACSWKLTDDFVGLTSNQKGEKFALKYESCENTSNNRYMDTVDTTKAKFAVYSLEVSKEEYENVKNFLTRELSDKKLKYGTMSLLKFAVDKVARKMTKRKMFANERNNPDDNDALVGKREQLVCSSFVAYALYRNTHYKDVFERYKVNYTLLSPNDLTRIRGAKFLFSGTFTNYSKACENFISKHPEFAKFYNKKEAKEGCSPRKK